MWAMLAYSRRKQRRLCLCCSIAASNLSTCVTFALTCTPFGAIFDARAFISSLLVSNVALRRPSYMSKVGRPDKAKTLQTAKRISTTVDREVKGWKSRRPFKTVHNQHIERQNHRSSDLVDLKWFQSPSPSTSVEYASKSPNAATSVGSSESGTSDEWYSDNHWRSRVWVVCTGIGSPRTDKQEGWHNRIVYWLAISIKAIERGKTSWCNIRQFSHSEITSEPQGYKLQPSDVLSTTVSHTPQA